MKRRNVQMAFTGEPTGEEAHDTGELPAIEELDDAVDYAITGGTFTLVVPHTTPDNQVLQKPNRFIMTFTLEDGTTIHIQAEASGVGITYTYESPAKKVKAGSH